MTTNVKGLIRDWFIDQSGLLSGALDDGRIVMLQVTDRWMVDRTRPFIRTIGDDVYELVLDGCANVRGVHCTG